MFRVSSSYTFYGWLQNYELNSCYTLFEFQAAKKIAHENICLLKEKYSWLTKTFKFLFVRLTRSHDWLIDWLIDWLTNWLSYLPSVCPSVWPTVWLTDCLTDRQTDCLTDWLSAVWLTDRPIIDQFMTEFCKGPIIVHVKRDVWVFILAKLCLEC